MNFIENYALYSSGNEAPPIYHRWAAISTLASLVSRRVWVPQGFFTVYPNLYILFVGNPGNGKSTGMKISRDLIRKFPESAPIAPASITREALTQDMGKPDSEHKLKYHYKGKDLDYCHVSIFANELVTLLGSNPLGMIEFLTDIWDEETEFKVKTKNKGSDHIPRPCVNLLGCMTPETTGNLLKESIISGGFARRCVFVYANRRGDPVPRPEITQAQKDAALACCQWGAKLTQLTGEFQWTDEAITTFDNWYCDNHQLVQENTDILLNGYYTTKNTLVLKIAMLLALSDSLELILKPTHITQALELLGSTEKHLGKVFEGTGRNPEASIAAKALTLIETMDKPINTKLVFARMFNDGNADEIRAALNHLLNDGKISKFSYSQGNVPIEMVGTPEQIASLQGKGSKVDQPQIGLPHTVDLSGVEAPRSE